MSEKRDRFKWQPFDECVLKYLEPSCEVAPCRSTKKNFTFDKERMRDKFVRFVVAHYVVYQFDICTAFIYFALLEYMPQYVVYMRGELGRNTCVQTARIYIYIYKTIFFESLMQFSFFYYKHTIYESIYKYNIIIYIKFGIVHMYIRLYRDFEVNIFMVILRNKI